MTASVASPGPNFATPMEMVMVPRISPVDFFTSFLVSTVLRIWLALMTALVERSCNSAQATSPVRDRCAVPGHSRSLMCAGVSVEADIEGFG